LSDAALRESLLREMPALAPLDGHNKRLLQNAHPPDWVNPEPAGRYNLVVLGAGTAGLVSAAGAAGLGAKVALVERHLMGGDCLNVGCVPSKALIRSARAAAEVRGASTYGIDVPEGVGVDFTRVMDRVRRLRADISPNDSVRRFQEMGVDVFLGEGRFSGPDRVEVGGQTLRFARAVIATGGRASAPPIPGLAEAGYLTNETLFALTELPKRLVVVGAGPIGCEMAQAFARLGSRVFLVENARGVLPREDPDAAQIVAEALRRDGVEIRCATEIKQVRGAAGGEKILALDCDGDAGEVKADAILVAVGRAPNLEGLDLEAAGVAYDRSGVTVDDHLRTSNRRVFAAGDVCYRYKFTHTADALARIVIRNALFFGHVRASALTVPWCTFTSPELAQVGMSEGEASQQGAAVDVLRLELVDVDRARLDGDQGLLKVVVNKGTHRILGATLVAHNAGDIISEVTLAIVSGGGLKKLAETIHPYPTQAEVLKRAGDTWNRTRLTPLLRRLFRILLAWRR
jgi:pyruvate/2-oxoglutarate dehydrogenase complex dihydrolipoamide dehydrogenase (E3) component